jgi:hypothetical protein
MWHVQATVVPPATTAPCCNNAWLHLVCPVVRWVHQHSCSIATSANSVRAFPHIQSSAIFYMPCRFNLPSGLLTCQAVSAATLGTVKSTKHGKPCALRAEAHIAPITILCHRTLVLPAQLSPVTLAYHGWVQRCITGSNTILPCLTSRHMILDGGACYVTECMALYI